MTPGSTFRDAAEPVSSTEFISPRGLVNCMNLTTTVSMTPLQQMTQLTPTCLWNDSAAADELAYSIQNGGVGATCNPVIVVEVLKKEMRAWNDRIQQLIQQFPTETEDQIGWRVVEAITKKGAAMFKPIFERHQGRNGRLSVQTDPRLYRDADAMVRQAEHFNGLAPNLIVKIPVTGTGIKAIEEATYKGISINATVCFTLPQCVAVAQAVERGLNRREKEGKEIAGMGPVCTIMVGRLDDWLKFVADKRHLAVDPGYLEWAGVAVFKKTYRLFQERGYRTRLLSAAFRNDMHWSEFIGGDVVISPPHKWQVRFNQSNIEVVSRIDNPVDPDIIQSLLSNFDDFRKAYTENGLLPEEFDTFPPTVRTLRQFISACYELNGQIRELMLPNPDDMFV
jgi:transaldolase